MTEQVAQEVFTRARGTIPVPPVDAAGIVAAARRRRRRRTALTGLVAAVAAVTVGAILAWPTAPPTQPALPALDLTPEANPLPVVWWGDGELHLADGVAPMERPRDLLALGSGVLVRDGEDRVVQVTFDGRRRALGTAGSPPLTDAGGEVAAWREPDGGDLVVYDLARGRERSRTPLSGDVDLVAFDRGVVYLTSGDRSWQIASAEAEPRLEGLDDTVLLADSGVQVLADGDGRVRVVQPLFNEQVFADGDPQFIAADGNRVMLETDQGGLVVLDARNGATYPLEAPPGADPRAGTFDRDQFLFTRSDREGTTVTGCALSGATPQSDVVPLPLQQCSPLLQLTVRESGLPPEVVLAR